MTLSDNAAYRQVIGSLMLNPLLLLEYSDIYATDFENKVARICFITIKNLFDKGAVKLTPFEVDQEVMQYENSAAEYKSNGGLEFLKVSYEFAEPSNFKIYYTRLKKYALLRRLKKEKYDISEFYLDDKDIDNPLEATKIQEHFDESSLEDILNSIENKYNVIRNEFLNGGRSKSDPAEGIFKLIDSLQEKPIMGPSLEGKIFNMACRGAREGCFFLKSASTSVGKAIPNYTLIPMANGEFKRVDEIKLGDKLIGDDGKPTAVIGIYPQSEPKEIYRIHFADGRVAECCEDHLWQYSYKYGHNGIPRKNRVESLKDFLKRVEQTTLRCGQEYRYRIPLNQPVEYEEKELYPSPYVMGALLGDGSFRYDRTQKGLTFSSNDEELVKYVADGLNCDYKKNSQYNYNWMFKIKNPKDRHVNLWVEEVLVNYPELWNAKSEDKFIPEDYLTASVEQRFELLRGLLDTDGSIQNEHVSFTTISEKLKDGFIRLIRSLGFIPSVHIDKRTDKYKATNGICYNISVKSPAHTKENLFRLTRKKQKAHNCVQGRNRYEAATEVAIVDIEKTGIFTDMTCFTVDNESHLFLMNDFIVTHNTRTSVFDACHICYPIRWSEEQQTFIREVNSQGNDREARKVLFIVTEMDKEELQTIMLAYLSGVDEDHILTGRYEFGEKNRVKFAAQIIQDFSGYFMIEEISEPNLVNVEATIKKYATLNQVKYVWFDYLHTTASMVSQFAKNNLREDSILMMMANQLKQIAKDYGIFVFSATQVNAMGMEDDGNFKNEMCIRGAKSVADKADASYVMTKVGEKTWNAILPQVRGAIRDGIIPQQLAQDPNFRPTHVIDLYKMRRGRFKNVRIWIYLHLGTGYRRDLFMTTADNQPIDIQLDIYNSALEVPILDWANILQEGNE